MCSVDSLTVIIESMANKPSNPFHPSGRDPVAASTQTARPRPPFPGVAVDPASVRDPK